MPQIRFNGDQGEALFLTFQDNQLFLKIEFPESAMLKAAKRDNMQYFNSRDFRIAFPDQLLMQKFLEFALTMNWLNQQGSPCPTLAKIPMDIKTLVENMPPQAIRDVYEALKDKIEELDSDTEKT